MFIKIGNIHINPDNVTHFVIEGTALTIYFVGGEKLTLDEGDAKLFVSKLAEGGRY